VTRKAFPNVLKFTAAQLIAGHGENKARALVSEGLAAMLRHLGEFIESVREASMPTVPSGHHNGTRARA